MPGMTGIAAAQAIRQHEDALLRKVVIIAITASVFDRDHQQSLLAGCDACLFKPVEVEQLLELLRSHLELTWLYAGPNRLTARSIP
jgi:CheY-like chemotaxis protein